jgi:hypothetical protein
MANSINKNEQEQKKINSSEQLPYHVKFGDENQNSSQRKNSNITQDESSSGSKQGL